MSKIELAGSRKRPIASQHPVEEMLEIDKSTKVTATIVLRQEANKDDFAMKVHRLGQEYGFSILAHHGPHSFKLTGSIGVFEDAFGTNVVGAFLKHTGRTHRVRKGPLFVPDYMSEDVLAVLGLDDRPAANTHFWWRSTSGDDAKPFGGKAPLRPQDVARMYGFPMQLDGTGTTVGLIELGGAYRPQDLADYLRGIGISKSPKIQAIPVDGSAQEDDGVGGATGEVMLDVEVLSAVAPGCSINIYFAPNTDQGFYDGIVAATTGPTRCDLVSTSWGSSEDTWTGQGMAAISQAAEAFSKEGGNMLCASGDSGSGDAEPGKHVDFPASSPWVLGCGGTTVTVKGGRITKEVVWDDDHKSASTGGGYSSEFLRPPYQNRDNPNKMRLVPDVAGMADPDSPGYLAMINGQWYRLGGTSAVAPLWAGLLALCFQGPKNFFWVNPPLYSTPGVTNDISRGGNGAYSARHGLDPCTGLGSPIGEKILEMVLANAPPPPPAPAEPQMPEVPGA